VIQVSGRNRDRLTLRNHLDELRRLAQWVEAWRPPNVSADTAFALALCLEEAVANIIMHANAEEGELRITVEVEQSNGALTARVEDDGQGFDPTGVPSPTVVASLADAKPGDLGIHLMRRFATDMRYERRRGRNRLTLRFLGSRAGTRE
jgi:anti-sigma regulatory factor (Ser/Thr protein kinase)